MLTAGNGGSGNVEGASHRTSVATAHDSGLDWHAAEEQLKSVA